MSATSVMRSTGTRKRSAYGRKSKRRAAPAGAGPSADGARSGTRPDQPAQQQQQQQQQQQPSSAAASKQGICVDILTSGYVQSFVDFFYLMHRPDPNPDPNRPEAADAEIEVPVDAMLAVKDSLTSAEAARRDGDTGVVYDNYNKLARGFQASDDAKTGIYFFEKCLEISRLTGDPIGEMRANHNLGLAYQRLDNLDMAIQYHGHHRDLVRRGQQALAEGEPGAPSAEALDDELRAASRELNKMFRRKAERLEQQQQQLPPGMGEGGAGAAKLAEAIELYQSGLDAAADTQDPATVGLANYRLGRALILSDDARAALPYLEIYRDACLEAADLEGQGQAFSALAAAHQKLENGTDQAVACLQQYLKISKRTDNLTSQAEACCNLGVIHNRRGEFKKAVHFFER